MSKKDSSSRRWLTEHFKDPYVKQAQAQGYRSRAIYKLIEMDQKDHLFKPGMVVIDLGASPGGWSQYLAKRVGLTGKVLAVDLLPMEAIKDVIFLQGDFLSNDIEKQLKVILGSGKSDWVLSDMAPNLSGNEIIDIPRAMYLAECAFYFAKQVLNEGGGFLIKLFQGQGFDELLADIKKVFSVVYIRKPKASKSRSKEVYILAKDMRQHC